MIFDPRAYLLTKGRGFLDDSRFQEKPAPPSPASSPALEGSVEDWVRGYLNKKGIVVPVPEKKAVAPVAAPAAPPSPMLAPPQQTVEERLGIGRKPPLVVAPEAPEPSAKEPPGLEFTPEEQAMLPQLEKIIGRSLTNRGFKSVPKRPLTENADAFAQDIKHYQTLFNSRREAPTAGEISVSPDFTPEGFIPKVANAAYRELKTIGAGLMKGGADFAAIPNWLSEKLGDVLHGITGIDREKLRGGVFSEIQKNADYYAEKWSAEGIQAPFIKDILFGLAKAGVDIPAIMVTPGGLAGHGALQSAALAPEGEEFKEALKGGATGFAASKALHMLRSLPVSKKVLAGAGMGFLTAEGGLQERVAGAATMAGLTVSGRDIKGLIKKNYMLRGQSAPEAIKAIRDDYEYRVTKSQFDKLRELSEKQGQEKAPVVPGPIVEPKPEAAPAAPQAPVKLDIDPKPGGGFTVTVNQPAVAPAPAPEKTSDRLAAIAAEAREKQPERRREARAGNEIIAANDINKRFRQGEDALKIFREAEEKGISLSSMDMNLIIEAQEKGARKIPRKELESLIEGEVRRRQGLGERFKEIIESPKIKKLYALAEATPGKTAESAPPPEKKPEPRLGVTGTETPATTLAVEVKDLKKSGEIQKRLERKEKKEGSAPYPEDVASPPREKYAPPALLQITKGNGGTIVIDPDTLPRDLSAVKPGERITVPQEATPRKTGAIVYEKTPEGKFRYAGKGKFKAPELSPRQLADYVSKSTPKPEKSGDEINKKIKELERPLPGKEPEGVLSEEAFAKTMEFAEKALPLRFPWMRDEATLRHKRMGGKDLLHDIEMSVIKRHRKNPFKSEQHLWHYLMRTAGFRKSPRATDIKASKMFTGITPEIEAKTAADVESIAKKYESKLGLSDEAAKIESVRKSISELPEAAPRTNALRMISGDVEGMTPAETNEAVRLIKKTAAGGPAAQRALRFGHEKGAVDVSEEFAPEYRKAELGIEPSPKGKAEAPGETVAPRPGHVEVPPAEKKPEQMELFGTKDKEPGVYTGFLFTPSPEVQRLALTLWESFKKGTKRSLAESRGMNPLLMKFWRAADNSTSGMGHLVKVNSKMIEKTMREYSKNPVMLEKLRNTFIGYQPVESADIPEKWKALVRNVHENMRETTEALRRINGFPEEWGDFTWDSGRKIYLEQLYRLYEYPFVKGGLIQKALGKNIYRPTQEQRDDFKEFLKKGFPKKFGNVPDAVLENEIDEILSKASPSGRPNLGIKTKSMHMLLKPLNWWGAEPLLRMFKENPATDSPDAIFERSEGKLTREEAARESARVVAAKKKIMRASKDAIWGKYGEVYGVPFEELVGNEKTIARLQNKLRFARAYRIAYEKLAGAIGPENLSYVYTQTALKMARLEHLTNFFDNVVKMDGEGSIWRSAKTTKPAGWKEITGGEFGLDYGALTKDGPVYVSPEFYAFLKYDVVPRTSETVQLVDKLLYTPWKIGHVLGSVPTMARNILGDVWFSYIARTSVFNPLNLPYYARAVKEIVNRNTQEGAGRWKELIEKGISNPTFYGTEIRRVGQRYLKHLDESITWSRIANIPGRTVDILGNFQNAADQAVRIAAFYKKTGALGKYGKAVAGGGFTEEQAIEEIDKSAPNYLRLPAAAKWLRRNPILGPFPSFKMNAAKILLLQYKDGIEKVAKGLGYGDYKEYGGRTLGLGPEVGGGGVRREYVGEGLDERMVRVREKNPRMVADGMAQLMRMSLAAGFPLLIRTLLAERDGIDLEKIDEVTSLSKSPVEKDAAWSLDENGELQGFSLEYVNPFAEAVSLGKSALKIAKAITDGSDEEKEGEVMPESKRRAISGALDDAFKRLQVLETPLIDWLVMAQGRDVETGRKLGVGRALAQVAEEVPRSLIPQSLPIPSSGTVEHFAKTGEFEFEPGTMTTDQIRRLYEAEKGISRYGTTPEQAWKGFTTGTIHLTFDPDRIYTDALMRIAAEKRAETTRIKEWDRAHPDPLPETEEKEAERRERKKKYIEDEETRIRQIGEKYNLSKIKK